MDALTIALLSVGGYAVVQSGERAVGSPATPMAGPNTGTGTGTGSQIKQFKPLTTKQPIAQVKQFRFNIKKMVFRPPTIGANGADPLAKYTREQMERAEKLAKEQYDKLSCEMKQKGADALNKQYHLDPPLGCNDNFEKVGAVVGAAAGAYYASSACGAVSGGSLAAVCGPLGAIVGAYLGKELGAWLDDHWDDIEKWAQGVVDDAEDAIGSLKFW